MSSEYDRDYYAANREARKAYARAWYAANKDKAKAAGKAYREKNRERIKANIKRWQKANRDKRSRYSVETRRRRCGFTPQLFAERLASQDNLCAICSEDLRSAPLAADHCHRTNTPRGILCKRCNLLLGHAKDSPVRLARALDYILRWSAS